MILFMDFNHKNILFQYLAYCALNFKLSANF